MKTLSVALLVSLAFSASAQAKIRYSISTVETIDGYATDIRSINNAGAVTGAFLSGGTTEAFVHAGGIFTGLGTGGATSSVGNVINENGWVGGAFGAGGEARPFLFDGAASLDLSALDAAVTGTGIIALNNNNKALLYGFYLKPDPQGGPPSFELENYLYESTAVTDLMPRIIGRVAFGLNDDGWLTGNRFDNLKAFVDNGTIVTIPTFGGRFSSFAFSLNNSGDVVGYTSTLNGAVAFLYKDGAMTLLGSLRADLSDYVPAPGPFQSPLPPASTAWGINELGTVVGSSIYDGSTLSASDTHAFVAAGGVMEDLNDLVDQAAGWTLVRAQDINDAGQIVGQGLLHGQQRGFILTPLTAAVPEPASWAMMIAGFGLVGATLRRRMAGGRISVRFA